MSRKRRKKHSVKRVNVRKSKPSGKKSRYLGGIGAILFIVVIIYLLFGGGFFKVTTVRATVPKSIDKENVTILIDNWLDSGLIGIKRRHNSVLFTNHSLVDTLKKSFIRIKDVHAVNPDTHVLSVLVEERRAVGVWCVDSPSKCFLFDDESVAFLPTQPSSGSLYVIVEDRRDRDINLGDYVADPRESHEVLNLKTLLQYGGIGIQKFEIASSSFGFFDILTTEGWRIKLTVANDNAKQIDAVVRLLAGEIDDEARTELEYIDATVQDALYYQ